MMSSCHREDQGERPPGVRNALFFPVVFRKAVINLIPSSSLPAPKRGERRREEGRQGGQEKEEEEEMQRIEKGWGTPLPVQNGVRQMKRKEKKKG